MLVFNFHVNFVFQYICKVAAKNISIIEMSKKKLLKPRANFPPLCLEMNHAILVLFSSYVSTEFRKVTLIALTAFLKVFSLKE